MTLTPPKDPGQPDEHNEAGRQIQREQERITHPETELRSMIWPEEEGLFFSAPDTELDIIEIYSNGQMLQEKEVRPERFASYCETRSLNPECMPTLRLILIDKLVVPRSGDFSEDQTTYLLHETFGVPIYFLRKLVARQNSNNRRALLVRRDPDGHPISVVDSNLLFKGTLPDGHYRFCRGLDSELKYVRCCTWFTQREHSATYVIVNYSESLKKLLLAMNPYPTALSRFQSPLSFHGLLLEDAIVRMKLVSLVEQVPVVRNLNSFLGGKEVEPGIGHESSKILNKALLTLCTVRCELTQIIGILEFLERVQKEFVNLAWSNPNILDVNQASESFACLKEEVKGMIVYLRQLEDKAAIKFNLDITLQNEMNSNINTQIARLTAQIAVDSKRDSSSMITMAVVTMSFLPGTFISALFSMVFFNVSTDSTGTPTFTVSPFWWLYFAFTIPLTFTVFAVWSFWQKRRSLAIAHDLHIVLNPPTKDPKLQKDQNELIRTGDAEKSKAEVKKSARASTIKTFLRRVGRARKRSPQIPLNTGDIGQMDD